MHNLNTNQVEFHQKSALSQPGKKQRNSICWFSPWLVYPLIQSPEWQLFPFSEKSSQFATSFELVFVFKESKFKAAPSNLKTSAVKSPSGDGRSD